MKNHNAYQHNFEMLCGLEPCMRYHEPADYSEWRAKAFEKLESLLGLPFKKCDPDFHLDYVQELSTHVDTRFSFQSEDGYYVPCHLLQPKKPTLKEPVFICLQGHSTGMHISAGIEKYPDDERFILAQDGAYGLEALQRGYTVLLLEQRNFGECGGTPKGPDCYLSTMTALLMGRTTIGERVWDVQRLIDVVERHFPEISLEKLACLGLSGGGTATLYSGCLDERIRYIVAAGALCTFKHSIGNIKHCSCNYVPHIAQSFDMGDLCGLLAPRELLVVAGNVDPIFPVEGTMEAYAQALRMYRVAGAEDNCKIMVMEGPHRFFNKEVWDLIDRFVL